MFMQYRFTLIVIAQFMMNCSECSKRDFNKQQPILVADDHRNS